MIFEISENSFDKINYLPLVVGSASTLYSTAKLVCDVARTFYFLFLDSHRDIREHAKMQAAFANFVSREEFAESEYRKEYSNRFCELIGDLKKDLQGIFHGIIRAVPFYGQYYSYRNIQAKQF